MTPKPKLPEFIFGELSTPAGRLKRVSIARLGLYHESMLTPLDPREYEPIQVTVRVGAEISVKAVTLYYTTDGTVPQIQSAPDHPSIVTLPMERNTIEWVTLHWCYLEQWTAQIPGQAKGTHVQYAIAATTTTEKIIFCPYIDLDTLENQENLESFGIKDFKDFPKIFRTDNQPQIYGFYVDDETIPQWLREAVIYEIFVDRFAPDPGREFANPENRSGFYGGTLKGIISKLDYLTDLGVTCLWLTPIFPSSSHHGYDPSAHNSIEPRLGTEEDWQTLVTEVHQRGIKIILDYVANHISSEHFVFAEAQKDKQSKAYEWFRFRNWPDDYDCFFDVPSQPEVDCEHPEVRTYLIKNACQWLQRGCDGFRLDYAHGLTHAFWSVFRTATREIKADSVTFGEITDTPAIVRSFTGRMDGCLDFKLLELLRGFFAYDSLTVSQFDQNLGQHFAYFGSSLALPSFLDNHDMNRFLWIVNGDKRRLKLAALCQFTLPGTPIIYYGTEVGLSQLEEVGRLEESRLPMLWGNEPDLNLFKFYQQLTALRRQNPQIWSQPRQTLVINDENKIYAYACGNYAIAFNKSLAPVTLFLSGWQEAQLVLATESDISWHSQTAKLELLPFSGAVCQF